MRQVGYLPMPPKELNQPVDGGQSEFFGEREHTGFLPGTSMRIWYNHQDEAFPNHWQDSMEIIVGEHGFYEITCMEKIYAVRPDEILIIPPGLIHSFTPREGCNGFLYMVDTNILSFIKSCAHATAVLDEPMYITESSNHKLRTILITVLKQMRDAYFSDNEMRELLVYSCFLRLVAEIGRHYSYSTQNSQHFRADKRQEYVTKFNEVLTFVNKNYTQDLTLDIVSKEFGFSKFHFSRLFKQYTGYTFIDYLVGQRIKAAERCLAQPDKSITEICFGCGFNSLPTFSRCFKERNGCTPTQYRDLNACGR